MKPKNILITIALVIVAIAGIAALAWKGSNQTPGQYDDLARCLTQKGVKMYGAEWCPHCKNQKELFGSSWQYVTYVECAIPNQQGQTIACQQAGVTSYPTWEFSGGKRVAGEMTFEQLSQQSGCSLQPPASLPKRGEQSAASSIGGNG